MQKLDFEYLGTVMKQQIMSRMNGELVFIRPSNSRFFRVVRIPDVDNRMEVVQVLNTLCKKYSRGNWLFMVNGDEEKTEIGSIFAHMDVDHLFVEPDASINN